MEDEKIIDDIKKFGWSIILIEATEYLPSFGYTVGLWGNFGHPELISFGFTTETLHSILNIGGELVKEGRHLEVNKDYDDFFENVTAQFVHVDGNNLRDYFGYAIWFYGTTDFQALQLVWNDRDNKYPWEKDFEKEFIYRQPLLDRNADFKFREEKKLAVFTTRQWLKGDKPIVRVVHEDDGSWQFLTGNQLPEDIRIVALEEIALNDPTVNEVFNLDYGKAADRECVGGKWIRSNVTDQE